MEMPKIHPNEDNTIKVDNKEETIPSTNPQNIINIPDNQLKAQKVELTHKAVTLTFKDLSYYVQVKNNDKAGPKFIQRQILKNISGICKPGELTAIMGASGAGKTSLLNILSCRINSGRRVEIKGDYLANGNKYEAGLFNKFAGYVMQSDILLETMTPREVFMFTARLRINGTEEERTKRINELITELKLERAADTFIGGFMLKGISGGERKRTSIGVELISDPDLLFLDEPTSGLDSFTSFVLINLLKSLANKGKNIIFTIHQPSSDIFFLFDNLMILAKGKFIYQGPAKDAVGYFGAIGYQCPEYSNPADYFIEIAHNDGNEEKFNVMYASYDSKIAPAVTNEVAAQGTKELSLPSRTNSFIDSVKIISRRSTLYFKRNPIYLKARIGQTFFLCFLVSSLYFQLGDDPTNYEDVYNRCGCLFFASIGMFMTNLMPVILTFPAERAVFLKEYSSNMYSVSAYFWGRQLIEIPLAFLFPFIMIAIPYYIMGLNDHSAGKFFIAAIFFIAQALTGNALGILVGSAFSDAKVATGIAPLFMVPLMTFGGFYINSDSIPKWIGWFQYVSPFRYVLEGLMRNEFSDSPFGLTPVHAFNYDVGMWECFGLLVGLGLALRFLAWFALKRLVRKLE